jgi:DNA-binding winged helix-turn-helix (wHTH) protein
MAVSLALMIVQDGRGRSEALAEQLRLDPEFDVRVSGLPVRFDLPLDPERIDLVIGFETLEPEIETLRRLGYRGPILKLGEADNESGEFETIPLPVRVSVLVGRLRSLVRMFKVRIDPWLTIGPYRLSLATRTLVHRDGTSQKLTDKEAEFLQFMHRARGEIVSREVLLAEIWGYNARVTTHTLETHIYRLRQKIERDPSNAELLITEAGGYRLAEASEKA